MLYQTISKDMVEAMKSHDKDSLNTIRLLKSAIDMYLVNNKLDRNNASDEIVIDVVSKQVKTHKESIEEFKKGNRQDLIDGLLKEIDLLSKYLPEQLTEDEIKNGYWDYKKANAYYKPLIERFLDYYLPQVNFTY